MSKLPSILEQLDLLLIRGAMCATLPIGSLATKCLVEQLGKSAALRPIFCCMNGR